MSVTVDLVVENFTDVVYEANLIKFWSEAPAGLLEIRVEVNKAYSYITVCGLSAFKFDTPKNAAAFKSLVQTNFYTEDNEPWGQSDFSEWFCDEYNLYPLAKKEEDVEYYKRPTPEELYTAIKLVESRAASFARDYAITNTLKD